MAALFLDSSALVKRYLQEVGSAWVLQQTTAMPGSIVCVVRVAGGKWC